MIEFDYQGIQISVRAEVTQQEYKDSGSHLRTRFERDIYVYVKFWGFRIYADLTELALIKSTLSYFMHAYWKRTGKEGSRIDLVKAIHRDNQREGRESLYFVARQKNKSHFLQVSIQKAGQTINELYLDGQEVIMLDIAIGKALNLLPPSSDGY